MSWSTILHRRDGYRAAFAGFDPATIAGFDTADFARLMLDPGIIRNRAKIGSAVTNAQAWLALDDPVGLIWDTVGGHTFQNHWMSLTEVPATTPESELLSTRLRQAGFRFVGPTICYALMQACGLVNDHVVTCPRHAELR